jgi:two-component system sensor histidine kinase SenX3
VVSNHGGEVTVWSQQGQGSTFTVRLPEMEVADDDAGPGSAASIAGSAPSGSKKHETTQSDKSNSAQNQGAKA